MIAGIYAETYVPRLRHYCSNRGNVIDQTQVVQLTTSKYLLDKSG